MAGFDGRIDQRLAALHQLLGELDDQDRVLRRKADDRDQAHLEVHVVRHVAHGDGQHRADHAERHHEDDRKRDRPAFIERRKAQEDQEDRQADEDRRLRTGLDFLQRLAGPLVAEARRQLGGKSLHLGDRITGGEARLGLAAEAHGGIAVVANRLRRRHHPLRGREGRERNHAAARIAHVELEKVGHLHAFVLVRLDRHALHAPGIREVVDIGRAEIGRDRRVDIGEGHTKGVGLLAIDHDIDLGRIRHAFDAHARHDIALGGKADELPRRRRQRLLAETATILQTEREAARRAETLDRRRRQREADRILDLAHGHAGAPGDRLRSIFRPALAPVLERHEGEAGILARTEEREAVDADDRVDGLFLTENLLGLREHFVRAVAGRFRGQLHHDDDETLVLVRQERRRQLHEHVAEAGEDGDVDYHEAARPADQPADRAAVTARRTVEATVEPAEETTLGVVVPLRNLLQEAAGERRRQRQSEEGREQDRDDHRQRELLVDDADGAGEEAHRNEHRGEHQRDADDRTGDLLHRLAGRLLRRQPLFRHNALDVFDDDDRIVDEDADGEHHGEHGQHIDREAHGEHDGTGAEQRDGNDERRNDRVTDVLQEQEHHEEHEADGFEQRVQNLLDRNFHEGRGVIGDRIFEARREELRQFVHACLDRLRSRHGVAARRKLHADGGGGLAVEARRERIGLAAHFDAGDVAQAHG